MSNGGEMKRREFLGGGAASLAALSGFATLANPGKILGANDRVRVAICGVHGRGMDHVHNFSKIKNVEIAAVCDIDENVVARKSGADGEDGHPQARYLRRCAQAARG